MHILSYLSKILSRTKRNIINLTLLSLPVVFCSGIFAPAYAASETIIPDPAEGRVNDLIQIDGSGFRANSQLYFYFSSDVLDIGDNVLVDLLNYEGVGVADVDKGGNLVTPHSFKIPEELDDGKGSEIVWNDTYYIYATYRNEEYVIAKTEFTVIQGEIETDPGSGTVGSDVIVSGEKMRPGKGITITFDDDEVDIISGDTTTDSGGVFSSAIKIPESPAGSHIITAIDESVNRPETDFTVIPGITLEPPSQVIGGTIVIEGRGFARRSDIEVMLNKNKIATTPISLHTNQGGSFTANVTVPYYAEYTGGESGSITVTARDESSNSASAAFNLAGVPGEINLTPPTNQNFPGHVGMYLTVNGLHFTPDSIVTVIYNAATDYTVTATADNNGSFSVRFDVPPSAGGEHTVSATDGAVSANAIFFMESRTPPVPVLLKPESMVVAPPTTQFDWQDVTDPSGVSYLLQVSLEKDFTTLAFEKTGLTDSGYSLQQGEELEPKGNVIPYYWRVKAIDGARNESEWTAPGMFYVAASSSFPMVGENSYLWIAIGVGAFFFFYRMQRRKNS